MANRRQSYTDAFKEQALAKVLARSSEQSIRSIAEGLNISLGTLRNWTKGATSAQRRLSVKAPGGANFTPQERLVALHETHGLSDEALNAWCRQRGVFAHDLSQWRQEFCESAQAGVREESEELRQLRLANVQLQRDLNRKDKALAEAGALLVLQKNIGRCGRQRTHERVTAARRCQRFDW